MNPTTYHHINRVFDKIITFLDKRREPMYLKKGGTAGSLTEPYKSYKRVMDNVFQYFNIVQLEKDANAEKYAESIADLEKECDCEKYKCKGEPAETSGFLFLQEDNQTNGEVLEQKNDQNNQHIPDNQHEQTEQGSEPENSDGEPTTEIKVKLTRKGGLIE